MRTLALCTLLLAFASEADARPPRPLTSLEWRPDGSLVVLPVRVNGAAATWFALDSGASHTVIDPRLAGRLGLRTTSTRTTTGNGQGAVAVAQLQPLTISIAGAELRIDQPWAIDLSSVPMDREVRGLVGSELFRSYVVRLDPDRRLMQLFEPSEARRLALGRCIPMRTDAERRRMFIDVRLDVRPGLVVMRRVRVDTGAGSTVNDPVMAQGLETRGSALGGGLGQSFQGASGRIEAAHIGPFAIRDVWGPAGPNPLVGGEILRRFVAVYDAPHGRLCLTPGQAYRDPVPPPPG